MEKEARQSTEKKSKEDYQIYWILGVMLVVIVVFFVSVRIMEGSRVVEYEGLTFTKVMFGEIPLYQYVYNTPTYSITSSGKMIQTGERQVALLLRNDPSTNLVPVSGEMNYPPRSRPIYVTFSPENLSCEYAPVAGASLSSFLSQNGYSLEVGSSDEIDAVAKNTTYITCETHPDNMVISMQGGEESSVVVEGNCHTLTVGNCEILEVTEKFIVQSVLDGNKSD